MGNFLGGIFKRVGDLVSDPVRMTKDTIKNPKKGLKEFGNLYTMNEHKDQSLFKDLGIRGWVGKHPQESALAVVGTVMGGWAAWGAMGAGGAAGATGAATSGAAGGSLAGGSAGFGTAATSAGSLFNTGAAGTLGSTAGAGGSASLGVGATSTGSVLNAGAGYAGTAGTGSGWLGASGASAPVSAAGNGAASSWQSWAQQANRANNMTDQGKPQQQPQAHAPAVHLKGLSAVQNFKTEAYKAPEQPQPEPVLGSNTFTPTFQNNF